LRVLLFALASAIAAAGCGAASPAPVDFVDELTGPLAPSLTIPFDAYRLTPEGLLRSYSASGPHNGVDRPMVRTVSGAYDSRDFVFEVTLWMPPGIDDIAWVGFGSGEPDRDRFNEPSSAFTFRIHGGVGGDVVHAAVWALPVDRAKSGEFAFLKDIARYRRGDDLTVRFERAGDKITLSVPGQTGASHTLSLRDYKPNIGEKGYLFFGNSAEGTVFKRVVVRAPGSAP
jgi:hypothetical protein